MTKKAQKKDFTPKPAELRSVRISISVPGYMAVEALESGNTSRFFQRLYHSAKRRKT